MKTVRTAVVGIGNIGSAHADAIFGGEIEGMTLAAVCDINPEKLRVFREANPGIREYEDFNELIRSDSIDAVVIAVPHRLHAEFAESAIKCGKHVLIEKPADISVSKAKRLCEVAKNSDRVFGIMFNQRTNPLFRKAREIVRGGELGELKSTVWIITNWYRTESYYDSGDWRATWAGEGGGVLLNQAPHNLDLWQWICGMPRSVRAFCNEGKYHGIEVEDEAKLFVKYENGAEGIFITSTGEFPGTNRLEISGDLGKIVLENGVLKWWKLREPVSTVSKTSKESFESIPCEYCELTQEEAEPAHRGILRNFTNSILFGEELIAPGFDGVNELMLSNAAYLSEWEGNSEIALPLDAQRFDALLSERIKTSKYNYDKTSSLPAGAYSERWKVKWE